LVLSLLSSVTNVSVYAVYNLVYSGIKQLISTVGTSFTPLVGKLYAEGNQDELNHYFNYFEWALHLILVFVYTVTGMLIVPFVLNYTRGVNDAEYAQPIFAVIMTIAFFIYCVRIPYISMVNSAGHFSQTQNSAAVEAGMNVLFSTMLVYKCGLVGVAIGTLIAMLYRAAYLCIYLSNNIIHRKKNILIKQILVDIVEIVVAILVIKLVSYGKYINPSESFMSWGIVAVFDSIIVFCVLIFVNCIFYKEYIAELKGVIFSKLKIKK